MNRYACIALLCFLFCACKKDVAITSPSESGETHLGFEFQAWVNNDLFVPDNRFYQNYASDNFTVSKFNYYISNIQLTGADGSVYTEPESYHLIQHVEGKTTLQVKGVPEGTYTKIDFLIGVDSLRNVSGAQSGALDRSNEMFWDWDQGYIFFKMEGEFNTQTQPVTGDYAIHIGGFSGPNSCLQSISFNLPAPVIVKKGKTPQVFYKVQIDEVFHTPFDMNFDIYYSNISAQTFKAVSDNYRDMLVIDKVQN